MSRARIIVGDCRASMATLPTASVDAVVCDPPYHLTSIVDRFGKPDTAPSVVPDGGSGVYARASRGFMGQTWDGGDIAFRVETWREVLRVLKPGGHLLAFSGSRTYHRMTCAIEDAGFEIRDQIMWVYGSGFPKSLSVSSAIDKAARGTPQGSTKGDPLKRGQGALPPRKVFAKGGKDGSATTGLTGDYDAYVPATDDARRWSGWGTALKPAHEPICVARKPLEGTVAANVLKHATGAINVDGCRVGDDGGTAKGNPPKAESNGIYGHGINGACDILDIGKGRWPANFIHDGSEEATAGLGEAARFFYTAKAGREDREEGCDDFAVQPSRSALNAANGTGERRDGASTAQRANFHPTVKPTDLMRYLVRMVTPLGGTVLDPFTGSGSTGRAAMLEGARFIGCELSPEYAEIARARIRYTLGPLFAHEVE